MKKIYFLILLMFSGIVAIKAQYVTIPDANFRSFLKTKYPSCFNGTDMMDTTCTSILSATNINCGTLDIQNLTGIEYFKSLQILRCENNKLSNLSKLPVTLTTLRCGNNQLTTLPNALPMQLDRLWCQNNQLTALPTLPANLASLVCSSNPLSVLPAIPSTVIELNFRGTLVNNIPSLPNSLKYLFCDSTKISSLPVLPDSLLNLGCGYNGFNCLPKLPSRLQQLYIDSFSTINCLPNNINDLIIYTYGSLQDQQFKLISIPICTDQNNTNSCTIYSNSTNLCTWTGAVNTVWEIPGNWSCNALPDMNTDALIPNNKIVLISSNPTVKSLTINPNASVTVSDGNTVTILH